MGENTSVIGVGRKHFASAPEKARRTVDLLAGITLSLCLTDGKCIGRQVCSAISATVNITR